MSLNIALLGCGKMGGALLKGWLEDPTIKKIYILKPSPMDVSHPKISYFSDPELFKASISDIAVLVIAVKPQTLDSVCKEIAPAIKKNVLVLSMAAGKTLETTANYFDKDQPVIRIMPNTPVAIGQGVTGALANKAAATYKDTAANLLSRSGTLEWMSDESEFNVITALSAGGPAYVFLVIELLTNAGIKQGLEPAFAERLARQTVIGSAALAAHEPGTSPKQLRENVTSKNGTTAEALKILMNGETQTLFSDAIEAATNRAKELSK